jgi:hypothetical protein
MKYPYLLFLLLPFAACRSYHYIPTTVNTAMYSQPGEVQGTGQVTFSGMTLSGGVAVTQHFNLNVLGSFSPEIDNGYNSRELEFSAGYQVRPNADGGGIISLVGGYGFGSNEYDKKEIFGSYRRPFIQAQIGAVDRQIGRSGIYGDVFIGTRFNWLNYEGMEGNQVINDVAFYVEPYYGVSIGGRNLRFLTLGGFALKKNEGISHPRVLPVWISVGMQFKIRKR